MAETRYAEYGHSHIISVLRNLKIFIECLPTIVQSPDEFTKPQRINAEGILKLVSDPFFIIKLLLVDTIFVDVATVEKEAQAKNFGPFDLNRLINKPKNKIESRKDIDFSYIDEFFSTGIFNLKFYHFGKLNKFEIDLGEINDILSSKTRDSMSKEFRLSNIKIDYFAWVA